MGLGSASTITLAKARELAAEARSLLAAGRNPLEVRKVEPTTPTFGAVADEVIAALEAGWRNPKHRDQWRMTLNEYCRPIRDLPVDAVITDHVLGILKPVWSKVPETASRLRGRIEKVLDAVKAREHRSGENPARWRGHLDHPLPSRQKLTRGRHKALPHEDVPAFVARLQGLDSVSALWGRSGASSSQLCGSHPNCSSRSERPSSNSVTGQLQRSSGVSAVAMRLSI